MGGSDIFACRGYSILPIAHAFSPPTNSMNHDFPWRRGFIFHTNYLFLEPSESNSKAFSKTQKRKKNYILRLQIYTMTIYSIMSISTRFGQSSPTDLFIPSARRKCLHVKYCRICCYTYRLLIQQCYSVEDCVG